MTLSEELVHRFQAEHLRVFGEPLDASRAEQQLLELAKLVRITLPTNQEKTNEQP